MEILEGGSSGADGLDSPRTHVKEDVLDRGVRLEKDPQLGQLEPMRIWVFWLLPPVAHTEVLAHVRAGADAVKVERALDDPRGVLGAHLLQRQELREGGGVGFAQLVGDEEVELAMHRVPPGKPLPERLDAYVGAVDHQRRHLCRRRQHVEVDPRASVALEWCEDAPLQVAVRAQLAREDDTQPVENQCARALGARIVHLHGDRRLGGHVT